MYQMLILLFQLVVEESLAPLEYALLEQEWYQ